MRAVSGIWLAVCAVACTVCRAEPQFPYELTVGGSRAEVRSGPGQEYYVTDHLSAGTKIEVYGHDPGGWLAIRPPAGSFSLVEEKHLQTTAGRSVAKVRRDGVECRVGSRVFKVEDYVVHVQLRQGELVELYQAASDTASRPTDRDSQWVSIWPPAGEFRWVHKDDFQSSSAADQKTTGSGKTDTDGGRDDPQPPTGTGPGGWQPRPDNESVRRSPKMSQDHAIDQPAVQERTTPTPVSSTDESSWQVKTDAVPVNSETVRVPPEAERRDVARATTEMPSDAPKDGLRDETPRKTQGSRWVSPNRTADDDIDNLELELAMMVSQEMRVWRLDALTDRVQETLSHLDDEADRVRARRLLARISQFEDLLNRASEASEISSATDSIGSVPPVADGVSADGNTVRGVTYDGTGWLVPVHASKGTVPPYALLDPQGDVLHYISPTPGLNLQRYVRKQIGVFGNRGYIPALNKPHVTAQRVVDLDRHLR